MPINLLPCSCLTHCKTHSNARPKPGTNLSSPSSEKSHESDLRGNVPVQPWQLLEKQQPPHSFFLLFFLGYSENLKSVTLAAPVLTWGSPAFTRASAQLIYRNLERVESRRGWFDCGQLWKWLCAMKPWQTLPDLTPHPPHSLRCPTGDISGPSIAKVLLPYSECKGGKEQDHVQGRNLPPTTTDNTWAPGRAKE